VRTHTRSGVVAAAVVTALLVAIPERARAEGLFTPFIGAAFAGDSDPGAVTYGAAIGATAGGLFGFELDFGTTGDIFEDEGFGDSSTTTVMGNLMIGVPAGVLRPYVSGGGGLIRTSFGGPDTLTPDDVNDFGINAGAGMMGFLGEHVGIRADLRYFRVVNGDDDDELFDLDFNLGDLDFLRGSVGLVLRW